MHQKYYFLASSCMGTTDQGCLLWIMGSWQCLVTVCKIMNLCKVLFYPFLLPLQLRMIVIGVSINLHKVNSCPLSDLKVVELSEIWVLILFETDLWWCRGPWCEYTFLLYLMIITKNNVSLDFPENIAIAEIWLSFFLRKHNSIQGFQVLTGVALNYLILMNL